MKLSQAAHKTREIAREFVFVEKRDELDGMTVYNVRARWAHAKLSFRIIHSLSFVKNMPSLTHPPQWLQKKHGSMYPGMTSQGVWKEWLGWMTTRGGSSPSLLLADVVEEEDEDVDVDEEDDGQDPAEDEVDPPVPRAKSMTDRRRLIRTAAAKAMGAFPLVAHTALTRANAGLVETEVQRILMTHFDFGQYLHRNFAKGWVIEDRWNNSIVFLTIIPYSGPVERLVHPLGGQD